MSVDVFAVSFARLISKFVVSSLPVCLFTLACCAKRRQPMNYDLRRIAYFEIC